jgi:hypothetical protein
MAKSKRRFYEGQQVDGRIVKEIFRNMAGTEYFIRFTDGSYKVYYFK